ncbi:MAG: diadenosine tetraphosphate (Ap4A) HIT family hydrolase [Candidatus Paceibacteria bacterium]|jgi:diadenosine tetraphosphate (Ap4A) HIT family hydrolase
MKKELIFETSYWEVYLMQDQKYLGRSLILLKRDCGHLSEISKEESDDFYKIVKKTEDLFKKTFNATMFNWTCLMNNAYKNNPPTPRVHWHLRPRHEDPVNVAGKTFSDPNFAHHYLRGEENVEKISEEVLIQITEELKKSI